MKFYITSSLFFVSGNQRWQRSFQFDKRKTQSDWCGEMCVYFCFLTWAVHRSAFRQVYWLTGRQADRLTGWLYSTASLCDGCGWKYDEHEFLLGWLKKENTFISFRDSFFPPLLRLIMINNGKFFKNVEVTVIFMVYFEALFLDKKWGS
jgi:hypothetical protein